MAYSNLFIEGEIRIGKSTLLQELLKEDTSNLAGYCVQRQIREGETVGFCVKQIIDKLPCLEIPYQEDEPGMLYFQNTQSLTALENVLHNVRMETREGKAALILLDEIGGVELLDHNIRTCIYDILFEDVTCIGVMKSKENAKRMQIGRNLPSDYLKYHSELEFYLKKNGILLTMDKENRSAIKDKITRFLARNRRHIPIHSVGGLSNTGHFTKSEGYKCNKQKT